MNTDKSLSCLIKTIAILNLLLFIIANLMFVVFVYVITMKNVDIKFLITSISIFLCLYFGLLIVGLWVYITWMKIEESIKGKVVAGRNDFWGILRVLKAYPLPIAFLVLMYMVIMPITFWVIHHRWVKIGIIK